MTVSPAPRFESPVAALEEWAQADGPLFTFLLTGRADGPVVERGRLETWRRACAIGAALSERCAPGDRALLVFAPGLDFGEAFFGCLLAGVVAVPAYPPDPSRMETSVARLRHILADCDPTIVLTTADLAEMAPMIASVAPELAALPWLACDTTSLDEGERWQRPKVGSADLAFLQYTSGSTRRPSGVRITHGNLAWTCRQLDEASSHDEHSTSVAWLPTFHDMGLCAGVIHPVWFGGRSVLLSPVHFLQRPLDWLHAVSHYRGVNTSAPNFGYELAARRATPDDVASLDLSCLVGALVAAERIRPETLRRFAEVFAPSGFRLEHFFPAYGLAEATVFVSGAHIDPERWYVSAGSRALEAGEVREPGEGEPETQLAFCGRPALGVELVVVDPESCTPAAPDRLGELWVRGPNVSDGYFRGTGHTLFGHLAGSSDTPWLRTGDVAFLRDGQVVFAGRQSDLLVARGRNHFPDDIEQSAERSHAAVRPGCVAAIAGADDELVVVAELDERRGNGPDVVRAIRATIAREREILAREIVLAPPRSLPKTSSGKIMRRAIRAQFLAGELVAIHRDRADIAVDAPPPPPTGDLQAWLCSWLGAALSREVGPHTPFGEMGMDSVTLVQIAGALEAALDRPIPVAELFARPTVAQLAPWLRGEEVAVRPAPARSDLERLLDTVENDE